MHGGEIVAERPIVLEIDGVALRSLYRSQGFVEQIAGIGKAHQVACLNECARKNRENIITAIAAENPVGADARNFATQEFSSAQPKRHGPGIGILLEPLLANMTDGRFHLGRARVRILIGVELDQLRALRLFAGHVAGHGGDVRTKMCHEYTSKKIERGSARIRRILADKRNLKYLTLIGLVVCCLCLSV